MQQTNDQNKRQQGFAHIGIVIAAVLVIAALAFGGWWVWNKNKQANRQSEGKTSQNSQNNETENNTNANKTFNCKNVFSITYPSSLQATIIDGTQCLISNVGVEEMPPVGPLLPEQIGLFFSTQATEFKTSSRYLDDHIERSQEDNPLELKSREEIKMDNGATATLAAVYGGHPIPHDFYFFVYLKDGIAIAATYPVNSNHKEEILKILKSIE